MKKRAKVISAVLAGIILLLAFSACGDSSNDHGEGSGGVSSYWNGSEFVTVGGNGQNGEDTPSQGGEDTPSQNGGGTGIFLPNIPGASASKTLVAEGLKTNEISKSSGASFMDMLYYCKSVLSFGEPNENNDATGSREYDGKEEDRKAVEAYINLLCSEYDFEVIGTPYFEEYNTNLYGHYIFFDYVLKYTGSETLYGGSVMGNFSKETGDLAIWGKIDNHGSLNGYINYNGTLKPADDGFRYGAESEDITLLGDSVTAGLYKLSDGSFETTDGRLKTKLGKAQVLTNGKSQTNNVTYEIDRDGGKLYVKTLNQYDAVVLGFYIPTSEDWEEGIYPADKFMREESYIVKEGGIHDRYPNYIWPTMFTALKGDDYILPIRGLSGEMTGLNVRLMYLETGKTAVFYTYCTFRTSPFTVEALIAVDLSAPISGERESSGSNTSSGSSGVTPTRLDCPRCTGGKCRDCNGTGITKKYTSGMWLNQSCDTCNGDRKCRNCNGTGFLG